MKVSIPNGMEFYLSLEFAIGITALFQFPTGWNSTRTTPHKITALEKFQFPTGWNSTSISDLERNTTFCFNSQRDGILLLLYLFSISFLMSFNSQRDGILRRECVCFRYKSCVSIPNGMEFYLICLKICLLRRAVSIPNGMEFYNSPKAIFLLERSFNSQRDGILLKFTFNIRSSRKSFNSQRDGILP